MAKESTYLDVKEVISLPSLSSVSISENADHVAFVKKATNWEDNSFQHHVWVYTKGDAEPRSLDVYNSYAPAWAPHSKEIAYLRLIDGKTQLFIKSIEEQRSTQLTFETEGVTSFKWDPDGSGIYIVTPSKATAKDRFGNFYHVGNDYKNSYLSYVSIHTNKVDQLTSPDSFHVHEWDVSPDGQKVAFIGCPSPHPNDTSDASIFLLKRKTNRLQKVSRDRLIGDQIIFSPQGNKICYTVSVHEKAHYYTHIQDRTLEIYDTTTGEFSRPLANVDSTVIPIRWTAEGILIKWQDKTNVHIGILAEDGVLEVLDEQDRFVLEASITRDGAHIASIQARPNKTFDVYLDDQIVTSENSVFEGRRKSKREIISWQNSYGTEIEGVLSTPAEMNADKKYPLLLVLHGGPAWASFPIFSDCFNEKYPIESFVEKGFIVLEPNYRGSSGYGNEFLKANFRKLALANYDDCVSGIDYLVERGIADSHRVGVMGWSFGGHLAAFCATYSQRFRAISVGGGITNWGTHYTMTDIPSQISTYLGSTPWLDPDIYRELSPITYITSASTPTLIQHGEIDARVPVTNAYELHKGLTDMNVDTKLIIFKGMAYSPDQPMMNVVIMEQNLQWFTHHLLGEDAGERPPALY